MNKLESLIKKWDISCIIFDLDGTLVNTLEQHIEAFQILFRKERINISYNQIAEQMGRTPKDTLLSLIPDLKNKTKELESLAIEKENILTNLLDKIELFEGAKETLEFLHKKNYILCLASSTPKFNVMKILSSAKIKDFFHFIVTGEDIKVGKPNPEVFLKAANKANISNEKCLVIGDSTHDVIAARNATMKIIVASTGKHSTKELEKFKPDYISESLMDLIN